MSNNENRLSLISCCLVLLSPCVAITSEETEEHQQQDENFNNVTGTSNSTFIASDKTAEITHHSSNYYTFRDDFMTTAINCAFVLSVTATTLVAIYGFRKWHKRRQDRLNYYQEIDELLEFESGDEYLL